MSWGWDGAVLVLTVVLFAPFLAIINSTLKSILAEAKAARRDIDKLDIALERMQAAVYDIYNALPPLTPSTGRHN